MRSLISHYIEKIHYVIAYSECCKNPYKFPYCVCVLRKTLCNYHSFFLFLIPSAAFEQASKIFEYDPSVISVDIGNQD